MSVAWDYDAAVLGSGPGGAAAATALAHAGRRVILLERDAFPRFHIGESLIPLCNDVFEELGWTESVVQHGFVEKRGATFALADTDQSARLSFEDAHRVREPRAFHVERGRFDSLLLDQACQAGAELRQPCRARTIEFAPEAAYIDCEFESGPSQRISAGVVIDATGRNGVVSRQLGLREPEPALGKSSVFAHYRGVVPLDGPAATDVQVISRGDLGWYWLIPIDSERCSIGAVFEPSERVSGEDASARLDRLIAQCPHLRGRMVDAERTSRVHSEANFSYRARSYAGERFLLVGDAGSFLDPIFSTGVYFALRSGVDAARAVDRSLRRHRSVSKREQRRFHRACDHRYRFFRRLITAFYTPAFRDLLLRPDRWPAGVRAVNTVLAGHDRPPLADRLRLEVFFGLVALQSRVTLTPRVHGDRVANSGNVAPDDLSAQRSH